MARLLAAEADPVGEGRLQGRLYEVNGYPGVVMGEKADEQVVGEVFRLRRPEKLLPVLDAYEGCGSSGGEPAEYVRQQVRVILSGNGRIVAWAYVYNLPVEGLQRIASGDYLKWLAGQ